MKEIIAVHYPKIQKSLVQEALEVFSNCVRFRG